MCWILPTSETLSKALAREQERLLTSSLIHSQATRQIMLLMAVGDHVRV